MNKQLFNYSNSKILIIGASCLDTYWQGSVDRISPEAPVPVSHYNNSEHRLAGAGLCAAIIKNLNRINNCNYCSIISAIGSNKCELNDKIVELFNQNNLNNSSDNILKIAKATSQKIRVVSKTQQLLGINKSIATISKPENLNQLNHAVTQQIVNYDTVIFYDDGSNILHNKYLANWMSIAKKNDIKIVYSCNNETVFKSFYEDYYSNHKFDIDYFIVAINSKNSSKIDLLEKLVNKNLLILDQANSSIKYYAADKKNIDYNDTKFEVENIIGNHESLTAVFGLAIANNIDINNAILLGHCAVNLNSRHFGQYIFNIVELQLAYADYMLAFKYNYLKLNQEINACRAKGQKIVFANGCFDVMHVGHFAYLQAAKQRGDKLFVAINSDCSVKRLKGDSRPVNTLKDRIYLLSKLDCVDWVVPFYTDTPCNFLTWLKPDVLVKGGDYNIDGVVGKDIVEAYGGIVEVIKHAHTEISSTQIIENSIKHV